MVYAIVINRHERELSALMFYTEDYTNQDQIDTVSVLQIQDKDIMCMHYVHYMWKEVTIQVSPLVSFGDAVKGK